MPTPALFVEDLSTSFFTRAGEIKAVDHVSFSLEPGQILGMVGESGSGKSITGFSLLGLVDAPGRIIGGRVLLAGENLLQASPERLRQIRGGKIAMIFQDPMMTLNPLLRIEVQMVEAILAHEAVSHQAARSRARDALGQVGISSPDERLRAYPHQFSGGMRQRVAIAIAMLNRPDVIIADEPTTALDVTIQGQILYEMQKLCRERHTALLWITHDLGVVSELADGICVMYAGRIVERGDTDQVLQRPLHPYTQGLLNSMPSRNRRGQPIRHIPGMTPSLLNLQPGCAFRARCRRSTALCDSDPPPIVHRATMREFRCFHPLLEEAA